MANVSGGIIVSEAELKSVTTARGGTPSLEATMISDKGRNASQESHVERRGAVYISGFRIVQDAVETRHCEYRVVIVHHRERYMRFSELKALAEHPSLRPSSPTQALPNRQVICGSREAWDHVRACKAPKGRALDPLHLSRKCLVIERFLACLLREVPVGQLAHLIQHMPTKRRGAAPRTRNRSSIAYLAPSASARMTGLKMRMR